ncbi:MAG: OmpA family protein [Holosporaceae bacterium]|nr:MAG: OmpA family protein [Holosporaceae bacterium]
MPVYQLNDIVSNGIGPDNLVILEKDAFLLERTNILPPFFRSINTFCKNGLDKVISILLRLSETIKFPWVIRVEGHADPQRIPSDTGFGSNWKMGYDRAYSVVEYMISKGLDAKRFYIASYSSYRPGPYPNNRRVSLSFDYAN